MLTERKTAYRDIAIFPVTHIDYPYPVTTVFSAPPDPSQFLPSYRAEPSILMLSHLTFVDYRYNRLALDPRTGLFNMIRYAPFGEVRTPWRMN